MNFPLSFSRKYLMNFVSFPLLKKITDYTTLFPLPTFLLKNPVLVLSFALYFKHNIHTTKACCCEYYFSDVGSVAALALCYIISMPARRYIQSESITMNNQLDPPSHPIHTYTLKERRSSSSSSFLSPLSHIHALRAEYIGDTEPRRSGSAGINTIRLYIQHRLYNTLSTTTTTAEREKEPQQQQQQIHRWRCSIGPERQCCTRTRKAVRKEEV